MNIPLLNWIEASENPWGIRLLDLRPMTLGMLSTSKNPQMAANAISYGNDDGTTFINQIPDIDTQITVDMSFAIDEHLLPGVLFAPRVMEEKWAIFFHQDTIIFVRSWQRKVAVTAKTEQHNNHLHIHTIKGQFTENESSEFTQDILKFLLSGYAIREVFPAPLPDNLSADINAAGLWAVSLYGNKALYGTFDTVEQFAPQSPLRSISLLHIAAARNDINGIDLQLKNGISIHILASDGHSPLHWALAAQDSKAMEHLLKLGANPNIKSVEGATPLMNAVQSKKPDYINRLISAGANLNAKDNRGFTALHRAAEMGLLEIVEILLNHGADSKIEAEGYTALSLAEMRNETEVIDLLKKRT